MNEDHRFAHGPVLIKQPRAITALNVWNHILQSLRFTSRGQRPSELSGQDVRLTTMSAYSPTALRSVSGLNFRQPFFVRTWRPTALDHQRQNAEAASRSNLRAPSPISEGIRWPEPCKSAKHAICRPISLTRSFKSGSFRFPPSSNSCHAWGIEACSATTQAWRGRPTSRKLLIAPKAPMASRPRFRVQVC
jgi:hypothetical protein